MGYATSVFTYLPGQGYDIPNLVSTIGALFMAVAVITEVINVIMTLAKGEKLEKMLGETAVL